MRIRIVAVGKIKEPAARELVDLYVGRINHYCPCEERELKSAGAAKLKAAITRATTGATVIALDERGERQNSRQLARSVERFASRGKGIVAFIIGGADGLPRAVVDGADACWSLSPLTFPHRLARVILAEQLYRAMTILRGEPYDR